MSAEPGWPYYDEPFHDPDPLEDATEVAERQAELEHEAWLRANGVG